MRTSTCLRILLVFAALGAAGCGPRSNPPAEGSGSPPPAAPPGADLTVTGTLTAEGVECPAMRDAQGTLYTLTPNDLRGFETGDSVCVKGKRAEMSTCMQGTTIVVSWIGRADECR